MANKDNLVEYVKQQLNPQEFQRMVDEIEEELSQDPDLTLEDIQEAIDMFEFVAENPDRYEEVIASAMQEGAFEEGDLPAEFNPVFVATMLIAFKELQERMQGSQAFKKGGLAQAAKKVAAQGRYGDTMLAHINPQEAAMLKRMGGSGTINPETGLPEFFFKKIRRAVKSVVKAVKKVAKSVVRNLPTIVAVATGNPWLAAGVGALQGSMNGGGLKGAVLGGLGGYLGAGGGGMTSTVGEFVGSGLRNFGPMGQSLVNAIGTETLGAGVIGGLSGALQGKNPLTSALLAGATSYAAPSLGKMAEGTPLANFSNSMLTGAKGAAMVGQNPLAGAAAGGLGQVAGNLIGGRPWNAATPVAGATKGDMPGEGTSFDPDYYDPITGKLKMNPNAVAGSIDDSGMVLSANGNYITPAAKVAEEAAQEAAEKSFTGSMGLDKNIPAAGMTGNNPGASQGLFGTGITGTQALLGLGAVSMLGGLTPQAAMDQIENSSMTEDQKAAMARNLTNYTASWNQTTLPAQGTPEYAAMMEQISQGIGINFMNPTTTVANAGGTTTAMKRGGKARAPQSPLSQVAMLAQGTGHGRSDTINARLSDGEYVIDAETVALLGNGSTKAGAMVLDQMRKQVRQQKGKALAKGKFSPDAKSPLAYMKGGLK